jgi:hypothetical protein
LKKFLPDEQTYLCYLLRPDNLAREQCV